VVELLPEGVAGDIRRYRRVGAYQGAHDVAVPGHPIDGDDRILWVGEVAVHEARRRITGEIWLDTVEGNVDGQLDRVIRELGGNAPSPVVAAGREKHRRSERGGAEQRATGGTLHGGTSGTRVRTGSRRG
jgi:hypothetical protein